MKPVIDATDVVVTGTTAPADVALDATTAPADIVPAAPSKMDLCKPLFAELNEVGAVLIEGKSARATFIQRAQDELDMTKAGAATYWQNLSSQAKGGKLYPHTAKPKKADPAKVADAKPADEPADEAADVEVDDNDLSHLDSPDA